jgi:hypothetical protein
LTSSFPICIAFISFSYHISLAGNSKTMLNKSEESGHPRLIPEFRENTFSFSPFSMILVLGLSSITFTMLLHYISSIPRFIRAFIMKGCLILSMDFSASIEMVKRFSTFLLLICCVTLNDLCMLNYPSIPGVKLAWSWCMIFLICCWIQFPNFYWGLWPLSSLNRLLAYNSLFLYSCVVLH